MVRSFIQTTAIILTIGASYFLLKVNLGLTHDTIARLSITYFGGNKEVAKTLARQSIDTRIGLFLLITSFALQIWNLLWPLTIDDIGAVNRQGILFSIGFCTILLTLAHWGSKKISNKFFTKSMQVIRERLEKK
jgi:hypothetical protein